MTSKSLSVMLMQNSRLTHESLFSMLVKASNAENTFFSIESLAEIDKRQFREHLYLDNVRLKFNNLKKEITASHRCLRVDQRANLVLINQPTPVDLLTSSRPLTDKETSLFKQYMFLCNSGVADYEEEISDIEAYVSRLTEERKIFQEGTTPPDHLDVIDEYTNQIGYLETFIPVLQHEQQTYYAGANRWRTMLLPNRSLPPRFTPLPTSLIQKICLACVEGPKNPELSLSDAPFSLIQISSGVRSIALSTPALWTKLHIDLCKLVPVSERTLNEGKWTEAMRRWLLSLSGNLPLSISVTGSWTRPKIDSIFHSMIIEFLLLCADRWRHMEFRNLRRDFFVRLRKPSTPLIYSLLLDSVTSAEGLYKAQTLKNLTIYSRLKRDFDPSAVDWGRLTHLSLGSSNSGTINYADICHILTRAKSLVHCYLEVHAEWIETTIVLNLPHLKSLSIKNKSLEWQIPLASESMFTGITAPNLEKLQLTGEGHSGSERCMWRMLGRSPKLKELYLQYAVSFERLDKTLEYCRALKVLHIACGQEFNRYIVRADCFLRKLTSVAERDCICPSLEVLRCSFNLEVSGWEPNSLHIRMLKDVDLLISDVRSFSPQTIRVISLRKRRVYTHSTTTMRIGDSIRFGALDAHYVSLFCPSISIDGPETESNILPSRAEVQLLTRSRREKGRSLFVG